MSSYRVAEVGAGGKLRLDIDARRFGQFPSGEAALPSVWILTIGRNNGHLLISSAATAERVAQQTRS